MKTRLSPLTAGVGLVVLLAAVAWLSLSAGYMHVPLRELFAPSSEAHALVLWQIRLPRIAVSALAGAALALSGAVFQGLLRNPLADPYTLGVSSGAALGAAVLITLGISAPWAVGAGAFACAGAALAAVIALAHTRGGHLSPSSLILAGVIVSSILSAALSFLKYLAGDQVASIVFWLLGSFAARTWTDACIVFVFLVPAVCAALWHAVDINIMTMGTQSAQTLGVDTQRVRLRLLAAASLAAAAAVSVSGIIGFVGLIVPHLLRLLTGPDHRSLLPLSLLGGAVLLAAADTVVRAVLPGEIPVGVLTALLAGPVFLVLLRQRIRTHGDA